MAIYGVRSMQWGFIRSFRLANKNESGEQTTPPISISKFKLTDRDYNEIVRQIGEVDVTGVAMYIFNTKLWKVKTTAKSWLVGRDTLKDQIVAALKALSVVSEALATDLDSIELQQRKWEAKEELVSLQAREEEDT